MEEIKKLSQNEEASKMSILINGVPYIGGIDPITSDKGSIGSIGKTMKEVNEILDRIPVDDEQPENLLLR